MSKQEIENKLGRIKDPAKRRRVEEQLQKWSGTSSDPLTRVNGIGPAIQELLNEKGIRTFEQLSALGTSELQQMLDEGGSTFTMHDPSSWPLQAKLAAAGNWEQLHALQERLGDKPKMEPGPVQSGSTTEHELSEDEFKEVIRLLELADSFRDSLQRSTILARANDLLDGIVGSSGGPGPSPQLENHAFRDNGDGTVTHEDTGLIWLKDADFFGEMTWDQARSLAANLESGMGDLSDGSTRGEWRLPTIRELFSVVDFGRAAPIVDNTMFPNVKSAIYWTSTTLVADPTQAWMMTLGIGPTVFMLKTTRVRFWPVRDNGTNRVPRTGQTQIFGYDTVGQDGLEGNRFGRPWPSPRFTRHGNGTVTDALTGLVWLEIADLFGWKTWDEALDVCENLCAGDYTPPDGSTFRLTDGSKRGQWRLPSVREAESLVDYGRVGPSIPDDGAPGLNGVAPAFKDIRPSSYWTSTPVAGAPSQAMFIIYGVGPAIFENKEHPFFVWPVRDQC